MAELQLIKPESGGSLSRNDKCFNWVVQTIGKDRPTFLDENFLKLLIHDNPKLKPEYILKYLHMSFLTGADPRINQVHLLPFNKKNEVTGQWETVAVTVFSYHFFINQANKTGEYRGVEVSTQVEKVFNPVTNQIEDQLVSTAIANRKDSKPVTYKARWNEYVQFKKDKTPKHQWATKPYIMLEKCAIAGAMRWQFPEALSNMYITEEFDMDKGNVSLAEEKQREQDELWKQGKTTEELTPGHPEFIFPDRKFRGKKLKEVKIDELHDRCEYIKKRMSKEGYNFDQKDADELYTIELYLFKKEISSKPIEDLEKMYDEYEALGSGEDWQEVSHYQEKMDLMKEILEFSE